MRFHMICLDFGIYLGIAGFVCLFVVLLGAFYWVRVSLETP